MANTLSISIIGDDRSTTEALAIALQTRGLHATLIADVFTLSRPAVLILTNQGSRKQLRTTLETARASFPYTKIIVLARSADKDSNEYSPERITDHLQTVDSFERLVKTLEALRDNSSLGTIKDAANSIGNIAERQLNPSPTLTVREQDVFQLIAAGLSNKEIADLLSISPCTVKNHVHNILSKLNIPRRNHVLGRTYLPPVRGSAPAPVPLSIATRRKVQNHRPGSCMSVTAKR